MALALKNGTRRRTKKLRAEMRKAHGPNWFKNKKVKAAYKKRRFPWMSKSYSTVVQPGTKFKKSRKRRRARKNPIGRWW